MKSGKQGPIMHLVGIVMKNNKNNADPSAVKDIITKLINDLK